MGENTKRKMTLVQKKVTIEGEDYFKVDDVIQYQEDIITEILKYWDSEKTYWNEIKTIIENEYEEKCEE